MSGLRQACPKRPLIGRQNCPSKAAVAGDGGNVKPGSAAPVMHGPARTQLPAPRAIPPPVPAPTNAQSIKLLSVSQDRARRRPAGAAVRPRRPRQHTHAACRMRIPPRNQFPAICFPPSVSRRQFSVATLSPCTTRLKPLEHPPYSGSNRKPATATGDAQL